MHHEAFVVFKEGLEKEASSNKATTIWVVMLQSCKINEATYQFLSDKLVIFNERSVKGLVGDSQQNLIRFFFSPQALVY